MAFKDFVNSDLDTFYNKEEFAQTVTIDGSPITVVIDNEELKKYKSSNGGEGLAEAELLFYARKSDFEERPFIGKTMRFNSKLYRVADLQEDEEQYTITLAGHRS